MNIYISHSKEGANLYPMHKHSRFEIAFYHDTTGELTTNDAKYSFYPGSAVIIPPDTYHSSYSKNVLDGIYIQGDFANVLHVKKPVVVKDNASCEAQQLARMIYSNRYGNKEYISSLCDALLHFLAANIKFSDEITDAVNRIIKEITEHSFDPCINLTDILNKSGYAEDYIRARFKKVTGKTPHAFLADIRISHARFLLDVYGQTLSLSTISENCGYTDYVYFSKKFKEVTGVSPKKYRSTV